MKYQEAIRLMDEYEHTMQAYSHALGIINVDGSTSAPAQSVEGRSRATAELSSVIYRLSTAPLLSDAIQVILQNRTIL